jgi:hypothetical protein
MKELIDIQFVLNVPKNRTNKFGGYNYRSAEDILKAAKPLLKEHGCVLNISDEIREIGGRFYIEATATLINSAGEMISAKGCAREEEAKKGMDEAQITGAVSSYARKYALNGLFAIDDGIDAESLNTSKEFTQKKVKEPAKETPQASLAEAIAEMHACEALDEVKACWSKYPQFKNNDAFKRACTEQGVKTQNK